MDQDLFLFDKTSESGSVIVQHSFFSFRAWLLLLVCAGHVYHFILKSLGLHMIIVVDFWNTLYLCSCVLRLW